MSLRRPLGVWLLAGVFVCLPVSRPFLAQTATSVPSPAAPASAIQSKVRFFRELLSMTPEGRQRALTNRPPENQQAILAKVAEYEALPPGQRELRLRATELWGYLGPLLALPPTNRVTALALVPADLREMVASRLEQWQIIPPSLQAQILADDRKLQLYFQLIDISASPASAPLKIYPPGLREQLEAETRQVSPFFDLTQVEKARVLETLSEPERRQMESTLSAFEMLPAAQRDECIRAFSAFGRFSAEEQREFLQNARRWQAMTPTERQEWRDLVRNIPEWPPLPPGFKPPPVRERAAAADAVPLATNRN